MSYDWPGNVRELERLIEGVVALVQSDIVELDDLPPAVRGGYAEALTPSLQRNESMRAWGSRYARLVLDRCQGNKRAAARALGISYHTLVAYLKFPAHEPPGDASRGERDPRTNRRRWRAWRGCRPSCGRRGTQRMTVERVGITRISASVPPPGHNRGWRSSTES